jgi:hypothetical protein
MSTISNHSTTRLHQPGLGGRGGGSSTRALAQRNGINEQFLRRQKQSQSLYPWSCPMPELTHSDIVDRSAESMGPYRVQCA